MWKYLLPISILASLLLLACDDDSADNRTLCSVSNLVAEIGDCQADGSYDLVIDFDFQDANNDFFDLLIRNDELINSFSLDELPLTIGHFQPSGLEYDFIKVCINDNPECCQEIEFLPPFCSTECAVDELTVNVGDDCTEDGYYAVEIDFVTQASVNDFFDLFIRNNEVLGTYHLDSLPLTFDAFPPSGLDYDFIKICINDNPECCSEIEFLPPPCTMSACEVSSLTASVGDDCNEDGSYTLEIDFEVVGANNDFFDLFIRNNELIGSFPLNELPLTIESFQPSGLNDEFIKVCINDSPDCCHEIEFFAPECESACDIFEIITEVGECASETTYALTLDFTFENPGNDFFDVFVRNNEFIGFYPIADLPVIIEEFPISGNDYDFIKVCINDNPECCHEWEFLPPGCK